MPAELRHVLHQAAASPTLPLDLYDVVRRVHRRRRIRSLGAAAVAMAMIGAVASLVPRITSPDTGAQDPGPSRTSSESVLESLPPGWSELLALPPPASRSRAAAVWTGEQLLVWGGDVPVSGGAEQPRDDGFVFDPRSQAWTRMARSPLEPRTRTASAWTGAELLVWGGSTVAGFAAGKQFGDGAAYDPNADSWRSLPPAPISARAPLFTWTGEELIVWGSSARVVGERPSDGAAYNPATNTWRHIATAPIALTDATAVWTGEEMILLGAVLDANNRADTQTAIGTAYHPSTDTWRRLPDSLLSPQESAATWNGRELIAWDHLHHAAAYDPAANTWRPLPDVPLDPSECRPQSVSVDGYVAAYCGTTVVYDPADNTWHDATPPQFSGDGFTLIPADPVILLLGTNTTTNEAAVLAYRPPTW